MPNRVFEYAGRRFVPRGDENRFLPDFEHYGLPEGTSGGLQLPRGAIFGFSLWNYAPKAPSLAQVKTSMESNSTGMDSMQIDGQRKFRPVIPVEVRLRCLLASATVLKRKTRAHQLLDEKRALPSQVSR